MDISFHIRKENAKKKSLQQETTANHIHFWYMPNKIQRYIYIYISHL